MVSDNIFQEWEARPSRWFISSGKWGHAIYDGPPGGNSPFAEAILHALNSNTDNQLNVGKLADQIVLMTEYNTVQQFEGMSLKDAGDDGGQFIFKLKKPKANPLKKGEEELWEEAVEINTIFAYDDFLSQFPKSPHLEEAFERIKSLEDEIFWNQTTSNHLIENYARYLLMYPEGKFGQEAEQAIQVLKEKEKEEKFRRECQEKATLAQSLLTQKQFDEAEKLFLTVFQHFPDLLEFFLPSSVLHDGPSGIERYFSQLREGENVKVFETRVILIGEGAVGKTSLTRKLLDPSVELNATEETTRGIDIHIWHFQKDDQEKIKARVWDFGGQEIYRSTHQFFFSKRTFYILVWEARREERFDYWLKMIQFLADSSPTILVQNKIDVRSKKLDIKEYKNNYKNIEGFFDISCLTNNGMEALEAFVQTSILKMPHLELTIPKSWIEVKEQIEADQRDYIPYTDFLIICQKKQLHKGSDQLIEYLHDLGIVLHFNKHHLLKHTVILNPNWATKAVYKVLDHPKVIEHQGYFNYNELDDILGEEALRYPPEKYYDLLELMKKFELCFQSSIGDGDHPPEYIVPELLPVSAPDLSSFFTVEKDKMVCFEFSYPSVLPSGLLPRFICRNSGLIDKKMLWRNGVLLNYQESKALVQGFTADRKIKVMITGNAKREMLEIIRYHFHELHTTLNLIGVEAKLPCNCSECINLDRPNLYDYGRLRDRLIKTGKSSLECTLSYETISVLKLFGELVEIVEGKDNITYNFYGDITGDYHQLGDNPTMITKKI